MAMMSIKNEFLEIESGKVDKNDNPLKNSPHTSLHLADNWKHPYSRLEASYKLSYLKENKFWPFVGRVDNAYGDKNLVCTLKE